MSFELQQPNHCGVASLRYALSLLGVGFKKGEELDLTDVRRLFDKTRWEVFRDGVTEKQIAKAARRIGLESSFHAYGEKEEPDRVIEDMKAAIAKGHVCLATWHEEDDRHFHWVCVAGFTGCDRVLLLDPLLLDDDLPDDKFTVLDEDYEHAPGFMSLKRFRAWITPDEDPGDDEYHFFMEVWPTDEALSEFRFVPGLADEALFHAMGKDPELITDFDEYIDDLRTIFDVGSHGTPACEYLERNRPELLELVDRWTLSDYCPKEYYRREIDSLIALTRCYRFCVPAGKEMSVMGDLAFYLGWRACEYSYDVGRYDDE